MPLHRAAGEPAPVKLGCRRGQACARPAQELPAGAEAAAWTLMGPVAKRDGGKGGHGRHYRANEDGARRPTPRAGCPPIPETGPETKKPSGMLSNLNIIIRSHANSQPNLSAFSR